MSPSRLSASHTAPRCITPQRVLGEDGFAFWVLRLNPSSGYHPQDPIPPSPAAFVEERRPPVFPPFTSVNGSWVSIFSHVRRPSASWSSYGPRKLDEYKSVGEIWEAWSEGTEIEGVGRLPPIYLLEQQWGEKRSTTSGVATKNAAWRSSLPDLVSYDQLLRFIYLLNNIWLLITGPKTLVGFPAHHFTSRPSYKATANVPTGCHR